MRRLSMAGQVSRQKAWLVVMAMAVRGAKLGTALAAAREQRARLAKTIQNSKALVLMWRLYVMRKRLRGLCKVRTLIRRQFFFWRMRRNIWRKRAACRVITDQLAATRALSKPHRMIRQFAFGVKRIQRRWRERQLVQAAQMEACRHGWVRADIARGLSKTAALHVEKGELELRLHVIKLDLASRKSSFGQELKEYRKLASKYEAWKEEQEMLISAMALMVGHQMQKAGAAQALSSTGVLDHECPPAVPAFRIIGPPGHFGLLAERLATLRDSRQKAKDREWAAKDRANLAGGL